MREGVRPGSEFHLTEYFGPVLGIMTAGTLDEAIDHVNRIDYGLTSGLHSLDRGEIDTWLRRVEAGNLYVNRGITGAIVQRQPFGGWKKAAVGAGAKAGGPNYLIGFGSWADAPVAPVASVASVTPGATAASGAVGTAETPDAISSAAVRAAAALPPAEVAWLAEALATDQRAWRDEFGAVRDATGLEREHNAFRYHAHPVTVRADGARLAELVRVAAAGARTGARVAVSLTTPVPPAVREYLDTVAATSVEHVDDWTARARRLAASGGRIRLIGVPSSEVTTATDGSPAVAVYDGPVTRAGRVELLPFLREQAVSVTAHRFGSPRRYEIPSSVPGGHHPQRTTASAV
ncbi:MAG: aldehyde dehydrogenase family protein [Pseudoclavibacter sp.]